MSKNKPRKTLIPFDQIINIVALITALIALYLSWEANQIANLSVKSNLVILSASDSGGFSEAHIMSSRAENSKVSCEQKIRMSNLGGAPTDIVNFEVSVFYKDNSINFEGRGEPIIDRDKDLISTITNFQAQLLSRDYNYRIIDLENYTIDPSYFITFPLNVGAYETIDISSRMDFIINGLIHTTESNALGGEPPIDYYPLRLKYSFITAQGQRTESPEVLCSYIK